MFFLDEIRGNSQFLNTLGLFWMAQGILPCPPEKNKEKGFFFFFFFFIFLI